MSLLRTEVNIVLGWMYWVLICLAGAVQPLTQRSTGSSQTSGHVSTVWEWTQRCTGARPPLTGSKTVGWVRNHAPEMKTMKNSYRLGPSLCICHVSQFFSPFVVALGRWMQISWVFNNQILTNNNKSLFLKIVYWRGAESHNSITGLSNLFSSATERRGLTGMLAVLYKCFK